MTKRTVDDIPFRIEKDDAAGVTRYILEPGNLVFCDGCGEDFTDSPAKGGILFQSKALCPACAPKWERDAKRFGEDQFIRARCPEGLSFADWVRTLR